jgi:hypothetical protein
MSHRAPNGSAKSLEANGYKHCAPNGALPHDSASFLNIYDSI